MARKLFEAGLGIVVTVALGFACYWVWDWAPMQAKGTMFSGFGVSLSLVAVFVLLSAADFVLGWLVGLLGDPED